MTWKVNNSNKCKLDTITASGTFRMAAGGRAGTVSYKWIRNNGAYVSPTYTINVVAGDTSAHAVVSDSWIPSSNGNEQLVFTTPGFVVAPQSFTCR